jgi:microcystin-dependent protein
MQPYLGQLMLVSFNFAPKTWLICQGQILPINVNQALFALLGTTFGGDGRTTFGLPDLRGRTVLSSGQGQGLNLYTLGQKGGEELHTLVMQEIPNHNHFVNATNDPQNTLNPSANASFATASQQIYSTAAPATPMAAGMVGTYGGGQGHENRQPFLALNWIIALSGIFPSQN